MVKKISLVLLCLVLISACFAGCKGNETVTPADSDSDGLGQNAEEYGFEVDENGNEVMVVYEDGKAYVVDENGKKTGETIKNPSGMPSETTNNSNSGDSNSNGEGPTTTPDREDVSNDTGDAKGTTSPELTTLPLDKDKVPSTSESGESVKFSDKDVKTITNMLEVPYLYLESYESNQKVPVSIATHVACWMLERENINTSSFPSGTVVVDLFNYFAATVVSFKTTCNSYTGDGVDNAAPITYNSSNDTFSITSSKYEEPTHEVTITEIQSLGNNNYYKVIGNVKGLDSSCKSKKVIAVIQKNKLDTSLGFSIKALKWS